jgi:hypothetical protein
VGASGSGKSSVVLAGLAPRLHGDRAGNWRFTHFRIGTELERNPFLALARALAPFLCRKRPRCGAAEKHQGVGSADQFEEAFTLVADDAVRNRFIDVLLAGFRFAFRNAGQAGLVHRHSGSLSLRHSRVFGGCTKLF